MLSLTDDERVLYFTEISKLTGLPLDTLLSLYLLIGDDLYCVLALLQGRTVKFPNLKKLKPLSELSDKVRVLELKASSYKVSGQWKKTPDLEVGDIIELGGREIAIVLPVTMLLGHYYTILIQ